MKNILFTFLLLPIGLGFCMAQTKKPVSQKPVSIESLYQQALQLYAEDDFKGCLVKLDKAETASSLASAKLLYLKTKTLSQLCQNDNQYSFMFAQTYETFIQVATHQKYLATKIDEIRELEPTIQKILAVKLAESQRLVSIQDSIRAATVRENKVTAIYEQATALFNTNNWVECVTLLTQTDTILIEPSTKIVYLKIKSLYPLFQNSPSYQPLLETAFTAFEQINTVNSLTDEQRKEMQILQIQFTERVRQMEIEKARKAKIAQMYQKAEQFYEDDYLESCIRQLDELESFLGAPNGKTLYMKIKALHPKYEDNSINIAEFEKLIAQFFQTIEGKPYPIQKQKEIQQLQVIFVAKNVQKQRAEAEAKLIAQKRMEDCAGKYIVDGLKIKEKWIKEIKIVENRLILSGASTDRIEDTNEYDEYMDIEKGKWKFFRNGKGVVTHVVWTSTRFVPIVLNKLDSTGTKFVPNSYSKNLEHGR